MNFLISGDILVGQWYILYWRDPETGELEKSVFEPMQYQGIDDQGYHFKEDRGAWYNNHTFKGMLHFRFVPIEELSVVELKPHNYGKETVSAEQPDMSEMITRVEAAEDESRQTAREHAEMVEKFAFFMQWGGN